MAQKPLRCRLGFHDYVRRHPVHERYDGPDHQVCRRCGRESEVGIPLSIVGG